MPLQQSISQFLNQLGTPDYHTTGTQASLLGAMVAATLAAKTAEITLLECEEGDAKDQVDRISQAGHSRREELAMLFEKEANTPEEQRSSHLIFKQGISNLTDGSPQVVLRESLDIPLTGTRISLDVLKLLRRLVSFSVPGTAIELEASMNFSLAAIASLRTQVELILSHVSHKSIAIEIQQELRETARNAEALSDEIVEVVRSKIF